MVMPLIAVFMVVMPGISRATAVVVMAPVTAMPIEMVPRIMPLPFIVMVLFPLSTLPIPMPIVVSVAIPARTDNNSGRRGDIHRRRRSVDRRGRLHDRGNADVYSDIDVRESDGRCAYAKCGNQCHRETATACNAHNLSLIWMVGQLNAQRVSYG